MCDKHCKHKCCKILIGTIITIALLLALAVSFGQQQAMTYVIFASRFFDVMLPILAVGALLKYLLCHKGCSCNCGEKKEESTCCKTDK